ncbi:forkhead box protein E3-like [Panicum virgatum]|uniref:forkhead box protein E3-like n=1 Tax=Panicum virgatum TaxID=38727 RepID=UPI0019D65D16|nr:forkhead box protein E3-like [Panicum virgatum]
MPNEHTSKVWRNVCSALLDAPLATPVPPAPPDPSVPMQPCRAVRDPSAPAQPCCAAPDPSAPPCPAQPHLRLSTPNPSTLRRPPWCPGGGEGEVGRSEEAGSLGPSQSRGCRGGSGRRWLGSLSVTNN